MTLSSDPRCDRGQSADQRQPGPALGVFQCDITANLADDMDLVAVARKLTADIDRVAMDHDRRIGAAGRRRHRQLDLEFVQPLLKIHDCTPANWPSCRDRGGF